MNATDNIHPSGLELTAELVEVSGGGLRAVEIAAVTLLGLLVAPPFLILAVVVAVPFIAMGAVLAAVVGAIAAPTILVRRIRAHHRAHGSTMFVHRIWP